MKSLREKIDRCFAIVAEIDRLTEEKKALEADIKAAALSRPKEHVKLEDAEREGRQFLAHGTDLVVPVVFTADALMQSFQKDSPAHQKIATLAGDKLPQFYTEPTTYDIAVKDGKVFRSLAREVLGEEKGPHFVQACLARKADGTPKSAIKIEWDRAAADAKLEEVARG